MIFAMGIKEDLYFSSTKHEFRVSTETLESLGFFISIYFLREQWRNTLEENFLFTSYRV